MAFEAVPTRESEEPEAVMKFLLRYARTGIAACFAGAMAAVTYTPSPVHAEEEFHYNETNVAPAVYFAALSNLANAVMFSGLGEALVISPYERDEWLRRAGFVTRPAMPDVAAAGPLYAGAEPRFAEAPDFSAPATLAWDRSTFDRTLDPAAQAWAMIKITSPEFHLQFHDMPENKLAGLMMIPQARAQAQTLKARLTNGEGLFAPRTPDGAFGTAEPRNQVAALWAMSNLVLAGTSRRGNYWHTAYRDLTDPDTYRGLLKEAFAAVRTMPPQTPGDRGLAIAALARFAVATDDDIQRRDALALVRGHAESLIADPGTGIEDLALAVFGLTEAARVLTEPAFAEAARGTFNHRLLPLWDNAAGLFRQGAGAQSYGPRSAGAVVAALNAMRWHGETAEADRAAALFPRFFEAVIIRSGLMQASPLPLVAASYLEGVPPEHFAHPTLPAATALAPVFASEAIFEDGTWRVSDPAFRTGDALFLANMLALRSEDGRSDLFLSDDLLATVRR
ncbi:hypothetical protein K3718_21360 (plasmid) [Leisingera aquaemixtae]|uniref:Uncharacterized protein n=1 Tax=Leisingera aquaemixtae TaxID=1396826 RepID=A0ABY5WR77_9RHOB|nr:hypothetical protein [Leisingera aquaemixtae]UWQ44043.1 hypothetical protein K3718_21360 [Leisingera aquaemixtae]